MSTTSTQYTVTGLTCGHCADAVTTELEAIDGVHHVRVDLVAGGESTVSSTPRRHSLENKSRPRSTKRATIT